MTKTVSLKEFKDAYTTITNNYVVEITTSNKLFKKCRDV